MSHYIAQPCVGVKDSACVAVCPVDCIHELEPDKQGDFPDMLYIDPDECIDCGVCIDECPVTAIFPEEDLPDEWESFIKINTDMALAAN